MHTKGEQGSSASQRMASFMPDDLKSSRNPALVHAILCQSPHPPHLFLNQHQKLWYLWAEDLDPAV